MTFAVGHVEGGTHAGWRRLFEKPKAWTHPCREGEGLPGAPLRRELPGYLKRCPDCHAVRP